MAFVNAWVETDPDGSVIPVSLLDDSDRLIKGAVRERLEGDGSNPNLTGLIEVGSFSAAPKPRKGTARLYVDTEANIRAYSGATNPAVLEDGRFAIASDSKRLFHVATAGPVEIAYLPIVGGTLSGVMSYTPGTQVTNTVKAIGILFATGAVSTTNAGDTSLYAPLVKAFTLVGPSDKLVATIHGIMQTQNGNINFKWGATSLGSFAIAANTTFTVVIELVRDDATATHLRASLWVFTSPGGFGNYVTTNPADSTAADETLDFRGSVVAGGTLSYTNIQVRHESV